MLHLRTLFLITVSALLLAACGGSEPDLAGTGSNATATDSTMAKAMGTTTVGSWKVTVDRPRACSPAAPRPARARSTTPAQVGRHGDRFAYGDPARDVGPEQVERDRRAVAELRSVEHRGAGVDQRRRRGRRHRAHQRSLREGVYWALARPRHLQRDRSAPLNNGSRVQITARDINKDGVIVGSSTGRRHGLVNAVDLEPHRGARLSLGLIGEAFGVNDARPRRRRLHERILAARGPSCGATARPSTSARPAARAPRRGRSRSTTPARSPERATATRSPWCGHTTRRIRAARRAWRSSRCPVTSCCRHRPRSTTTAMSSAARGPRTTAAPAPCSGAMAS